METIYLMAGWEFNEKNPKAEPLYVAPDGRILRFALRPGQVVEEHSAPHSPVYLVVLKGHGLFAGADGLRAAVWSARPHHFQRRREPFYPG